MEIERTPPERLKKQVTNCLDCLQIFWRVYTETYSKEEYIELIGQDPYVQRRYLWSIQHLQRLKEDRIISPRDNCLFEDYLEIECDSNDAHDI